MLVTVVRSKIGGVVELPDDINIRPFNFVELKSLTPEMKRALVLLEKAGSVSVAQVPDVGHLMNDGAIENAMPSDTTGAASAMLQSDEDRRASLERVADLPDVLTDYSKFHAVSTEELAERKADLEEKIERAKASGDGLPVMRVAQVSGEPVRTEGPKGPATTVEEAEERLGETEVERADAAVEAVTVGAPAAEETA